MKLKLILSLTAILTLSASGLYFYQQRLQPQQTQQDIPAPVVKESDTPAFHAVVQQDNLIVSLKPDHFAKSIKSIAVTYRDVFYGVYLVSDKIYLTAPVTDDKAELILSPLDERGNPVATETFMVGELLHDSVSKISGH